MATKEISVLNVESAGGDDALGYAGRVGIATGAGSKYRHGEMELNFSNAERPITHGIAWAAQQKGVDRLMKLVLVGARMVPSEAEPTSTTT